MEQNTNPEASQNCFLPTGTDHRKEIPTVGNEIYLYDEAEPLAYVCSETSMPPTSSIRMAASAGKPSMSERSSNDSKTSHKKSRKSSTMVYESSGWYEKSIIQSPRSAGGSIFAKDQVSDFKSTILNKFKEFTKTPNSSCLDLKDRADSVDLGSEKTDLSSFSRNRSRNNSEDIEEIFHHKAKFIVSSSESDRLRITSDDHQDEVFSTGVSDMEDGATGGYNMTSANPRMTNGNVNSKLPQHHGTQSTAKEATSERLGGTSPNRIGPPVQGKLSLRALKASPPCFCLLEEIKKNNLVMVEDIFSSSKTKADELLENFTPNTAKYNHGIDAKNRTNVTRERELLNVSPNKPGNSSRIAAVKKNDLRQQSRSNTIEIYEATGGEEKAVGNSKLDSEEAKEGGQRNRQIPVTPDVKALTANIRLVRNQYEESWRPFKPPYSSQGAIEPSAKTGVLTSNNNTVHQKTNEAKQPSSDTTIHSNAHNSGGKNERNLNHQLNDYHQANVSTPNRRNERYVKLPGLADAFDQHDSNFKGLRITNGTSFESVNALEELSLGNIANQIMDMNKREIRGPEELVTHRKTETKDAATDVTTSLKNTKTQTGFDKTMVDSYMQCESHIVDEVNGRNVVKNDHQEILVCNDNGDGVQLYNELGHPLTDMDGYLLKDSLGRFLVRLDDYGVPISCTNGQGIFMEDSRSWNTVKNTMNIIHQCKKKQINRRGTARKACSSVRKLENAMKNLRNTLEWADELSLDSIHENAMQRLPDFELREHPRPLKSTEPCVDSGRTATGNNTSSLIAEMKSIARLRTALLEKVNFIVDNRKKLEKPRKTPTFLGMKRFSTGLQDSSNTTRLGNPTSLLLSQDRPHSPTYRAVKMLKGSEANSEADSISSVDNFADKIMSKTGDNIRSALWKTSVGGRVFGDTFSTGRKSGGKLKAANDLWMNLITDKSIDSGAPVTEKSTGNETDFWRMIRSTDDYFPTSSKKYANLYEDNKMSDMKLVSKDIEGPGSTSGPGKGNSNESGLKESQLLCSLEKEYNLKIDDSWIQPWNEGKSPFNQALNLPFI